MSLLIKWPDDECKKELKIRGNYEEFDDTKEICFGYKETDSCEGDSGKAAAHYLHMETV